jgi:hypothetical protein
MLEIQILCFRLFDLSRVPLTFLVRSNDSVTMRMQSREHRNMPQEIFMSESSMIFERCMKMGLFIGKNITANVRNV